MLDIIVGIIVLLFVFLGSREGIVKSLGSVAVVFISLFLAGAALNFLAQSNSQFADPEYLAASIIFLLVFVLSYLLLDFLLNLLFKKVVHIVILGSVDKIGGLLIGGVKGFLICGIVLQMMFSFPISDATKNAIRESMLSKFSMSLYQWAYPYAKQINPKVTEFMNNSLVDKINQKEIAEPIDKEISNTAPAKVVDKMKDVRQIKDEQGERIEKLLKEHKIVPDVPGEK
jgi:uncharacterized membrane protein required for colicin V production